MINNNRVSPYSRETNQLKQNRIDIQENSNDNNSNDNSLRGNTNNNNNNQIIRIADSQVAVEFNCCGTPHFNFGKTLFFYFPNSLNNTEISKEYHSTTVKLSEMPDPPFSLGPECKFYFFILFFI